MPGVSSDGVSPALRPGLARVAGCAVMPAAGQDHKARAGENGERSNGNARAAGPTARAAPRGPQPATHRASTDTRPATGTEERRRPTHKPCASIDRRKVNLGPHALGEVAGRLNKIVPDLDLPVRHRQLRQIEARGGAATPPGVGLANFGVASARAALDHRNCEPLARAALFLLCAQP